MISVGNWQLDFGNPLVGVLSLALLAALVLTLRAVWIRLFRRRRWRALAVSVLNLAAFVAVLLLLLGPRHTRLGEKTIVLMTEGFTAGQYSSAAGASVYVSPGVVPSQDNRKILDKANWLLDVAQLKLREAAMTTVEIRGYGLHSHQWQSLGGDFRVEFDPPPIHGFTDVRWPRNLADGQTLRIEGQFTSENGSAVIQLRLLDPAGDIAAVSRISNADSFSLAARPRGPGMLEYSLQAWDGDTLESEQPVPVGVGTPPPLNIMIEQSAASFDTRQLKNHAGEDGHRLLVNTRISRDRQISQLVNLPDGSDTALSPQNLAAQDILIMDGRALTRLAPGSRQWLDDAIKQGLGLLILADQALLDDSASLTGLWDDIDLVQLPTPRSDAVPRLLNGKATDWNTPLPVAALQVSAPGAQVLVDDGNGRTLVLKRRSGLGNIAISLMRHSHGWLTSGNRAAWSEYWSALFTSITRPRRDSHLLRPPDASHHMLMERTPVCALSAGQELEVTVIPPDAGGEQPAFEIRLAGDTLGSAKHCAYFWPQSSGWHQILLRSITNASIIDQQAVYIFDNHQWQAWQHRERVAATRSRAAGNRAEMAPGPAKQVPQAVDTFWFWVLLVISSTLLWLERRFDFRQADNFKPDARDP